MKLLTSRFVLVILAGLAFIPLPCKAVPSFARQTGLQCIACHTEFPELNAFGRLFKLNGYVLSNGLSTLPPVALMLQPSFTNTALGQAGGAAPGFGPNNNLALTQMSLFYAGRLFGPYASKLFGDDGATFANKFGIFMQTTYDGIGDRLNWDNTELRYADLGTISDKQVIYGLYLNNNPTMQDPWNSTPAWGFPFSSTGLPPADQPPSPLIDGGLAQQVAGAGGYLFYDNSFYLDVAGYHSLSAQLQNSLGIDPDGETQVADLAPYWRAAYTKAVDNNNFEIGTFGLAADSFPGRDHSVAKDRTLDLGLDAQAQFAFTQNDITVMTSWIHERDSWDASQPLGLATNGADNLNQFKFTVDYLYDKTYGASVQYFDVSGSQDSLLYSTSASGSPNSSGEIFQLYWMPFNKGGGPSFWPMSNVKFTLQYTMYNTIYGASKNYDGAGHNASDNNTLYLEAWIAF